MTLPSAISYFSTLCPRGQTRAAFPIDHYAIIEYPPYVYILDELERNSFEFHLHSVPSFGICCRYEG